MESDSKQQHSLPWNPPYNEVAVQHYATGILPIKKEIMLKNEYFMLNRCFYHKVQTYR